MEGQEQYVSRRWQKAPIMSGIPRKWTRERILTELKRAGKSFPEAVGKKIRKRHGLYGALLRTFGSLENAKLAAGLPAEPDVGLERQRVGKGLNAWAKRHGVVHGESLRKKGHSLYSQARTHFGTVQEAALQFNVPYQKRKNEWNKDRVLDAIRKRHAQNLPMGPGSVSKHDKALVSAGQRQFGSWKAAVEAAGIPFEWFERTATRSEDDFRELIETWIKIHGPLEWKKLNQTDRKLRHAVESRFQTVEQAARNFGLPYKGVYQRWSKQRVLDELNARHKNGLSMKVRDIHRSDTKLYKAAYRHFGTVGNALEAAGVGADNLRSSRSNSEVLARPAGRKDSAALSEGEKAGKQKPQRTKLASSPPRRRGRARKHHVDEDYVICLVCKEQLRTISYSHLRMHGMTTDEYKQRFGVDTVFSVSVRRTNSENKRKSRLDIPFEPLDRDEIIARLQEYDKEQSPLSAEKLYARDPSLLNQAHRIFGEWPTVLKAAGLDCRENQVRSKDEVDEALRNWSGKHGTISYVLLRETDPTLAGQAAWRYGSVMKAALALKLPFEERYQTWTKASVIEKVKTRERSGGDLRMGASTTQDGALVVAACRRFGTWEAALEAAGLDYASIRGTKSWSNEAVLSEIKQRQAMGKSLRTSMLKEEGNQSLMGAACKRFGSWAKAVEAAGIDYESITGRIKWTREKLIERMRQRHKAGDSLDHQTIRREEGRLLTAAHRLFGSWAKAVKMARLKPTAKRGRK